MQISFMIKTKTSELERLCQGDIIKNVEYIESISENSGILEINKILFPLVIVLTQDCDLEQDYCFRIEEKDTQDKWIISVLIAPLYNAEHIFTGEHLEEIGIKSQKINKQRTDGKNLKQNQNPRYHYLEFPKEINIVPSVIDFKHYFAVPVIKMRDLKTINYICSVSELYREDISHRFAAYLSRIGLPGADPQNTNHPVD